MTLEEKEAVVLQIVHESNDQPIEVRKRHILNKWRSTLEKEPHHLTPHQIDEIVREVRRRLVDARD